MTLQQVKEQVAYDSDYPDCNALVNEMAGDIEIMEFYLDIIARQYAKQVAKDTLNRALLSINYDEVPAKYINIIRSTPIQLP